MSLKKNDKPSLPRRKLLMGAAAAPAALLAAPAVAQERIEWSLVTSWPRNLPGPGTTAQTIAERITRMTDGRLTVTLHAAGEMVPALEVFDAVSGNVAQMGHTASFFWSGKISAAPFFTAVPFGLTAQEHAAWIYHGGGQALWDELYGGFGIKPFMAGNTGMGMGGWFKNPITSLEDLKGLKYRMPGLGGEVFKALGALPVVVAPGEILSALQSGAIDGAEFLGPWSDLALGFYKVAKIYHWPGFHEPNGSGECLVNRARFEALPADLQEVVVNACAAENARSLAETEWRNGEALDTLVTQHGVEVRPFPQDVLAAARDAAAGVLRRFREGDGITRRIAESYGAARQRAMGWSGLSTLAYLQARSNKTH